MSRAPRHWQPAGALPVRGRRPLLPEIGQIIGYIGDRKAWRVVKITDVHQSQWVTQTVNAWERAGRPDPETWEGRERRLGCEPARNPQPNRKDRRGFLVYPWASGEQWWALYDPWPECTGCGLLWPCPCKERNDEAAAAMAELERVAAILPGCCWACTKPITERMYSVEFDGDNLLLPGAGPVAFHIAGAHKPERAWFLLGEPAMSCRGAAIAYEKRWVEAAPGRLIRLTCPGTQFRHYESYECDTGDLCPGPGADHARDVHCSVGYGYSVPGRGHVDIRPQLSCGGKGCRGGAV